MSWNNITPVWLLEWELFDRRYLNGELTEDQYVEEVRAIEGLPPGIDLSRKRLLSLVKRSV